MWIKFSNFQNFHNCGNSGHSSCYGYKARVFTQSFDSIGWWDGCGSHARFSLWQLFYNTSTWFMTRFLSPQKLLSRHNAASLPWPAAYLLVRDRCWFFRTVSLSTYIFNKKSSQFHIRSNFIAFSYAFNVK